MVWEDGGGNPASYPIINVRIVGVLIERVRIQSCRKESMIEVTRIWERLFIGGRNDAEHLICANPFEIATAVWLCKEQVLRRAAGINYVHLPLADDKRIEVGPFDAVIDAIGENIRWGTVLLHCGSGVGRAPILTAAWMHVVGYKNIDMALQEIAGLRPTIAPSGILLSSVREHLR